MAAQRVRRAELVQVTVQAGRGASQLGHDAEDEDTDGEEQVTEEEQADREEESPELRYVLQRWTGLPCAPEACAGGGLSFLGDVRDDYWTTTFAIIAGWMRQA